MCPFTKDFNFDRYAVHTGPLAYQYADCLLPGGTVDLAPYREVTVYFNCRHLLLSGISLVATREEASREKREKALEEQGESGEP